MFRRRSTGRPAELDGMTDLPPAWTQFSFPTYWHYDVLRGLDYVRAAGAVSAGCLRRRPSPGAHR